ncbi:PIN domain-containing protein [Pseudomonas resinovorans]|uniref:PIN domain-containing protein n=1 Tax=Metapseudomonas resinovorans TaxID=53412 RepID=A0ABT4Y749_METRE|nr:PIN domain-containing protein [Pseudomonas resinovorans]MDA8484586.1 PIN domain-containing protein [Pseudomonas resinovorans]
MRTNYVLIDYENVQVQSLDLLQQPQFKIRVFLGPNNTKLPAELVVAMQCLGDRAGYIQLDTPGQNALDFHVAYYLGRLAVEEPDAFFHIISRDKGFDPLIKHLKSKGIFAARSESIEGMPCFSPPKIVPPPAPKLEPVKSSPPKTTKAVSESDVNLVIADLVGRKASRPRTIKTLLNTIRAKLGKQTIEEIEGIYQVLRHRGYINEAGTKVSYTLPKSAKAASS